MRRRHYIHTNGYEKVKEKVGEEEGAVMQRGHAATLVFILPFSNTTSSPSY